MKKKITVLPGDGIGPEVISEAIKILDCIALKHGHQFDYSYSEIGAASIKKNNVPLTAETIDLCLGSDAVLMGAIGHPDYDNNPNLSIRPEKGLLQLRKSLGVYANIRPIKTYPSLYNISPVKNEKLKEVDILICRELTGGIYFGKKSRSSDNNSAEDICSYSRQEISRIAHFAFRQAMERKKKVMLVDKANVLETSRLWRDEVKQIHQKDYPQVQLDFMYVDNAAMQLILNPAQFDVLLTENMFGDILSDEASVLTGSLGLLPSSSIGAGTPLFEPIHGSFPQAAGKNSANPVATILSAAMMLDYFGMRKEAQDISDAVNWSVSNAFCTSDIVKQKPLTCSLVGDCISKKIKEGASFNMKKEDLPLDYKIV